MMAKQGMSRKRYLEMLDSGDLVTIHLPSSAESYNILKAKLYEHSGYFRGLFACLTKDELAQPIKLDDTTATVLKGIISYVYDQTLSFDHQDMGFDWTIDEDPPYLIDLYLFADKYDFQHVRNGCVKVMFEAIDEGQVSPLSELPDDIWVALTKAFTGLPPTAKLYQLLFEWLCGGIGRMGSEKQFELLAKQEVGRMMDALRHSVAIKLIGSRSQQIADRSNHGIGGLHDWLEDEEKLIR